MGIGVKVSCPCFGSFTVPLGPRLRPPQSCRFPFMCTECDGASYLDIYAHVLACEHCGSASVLPYGSPSAVGKLGTGVVLACTPCDKFSADQLTLTDGTYWCPTCRSHNVRFSD